MKKLAITALMIPALFLTGCGEKPMTDADMASKYNLSIEEYQEQKEAASRMNMSIEEHLGGGMDMDMDSNDSDMDHEGMDHAAGDNH